MTERTITVSSFKDDGSYRSKIRIPSTLATQAGLRVGSRVNVQLESRNTVRISASKTGTTKVTRESDESVIVRARSLVKRAFRARPAKVTRRGNGTMTLSLA